MTDRDVWKRIEVRFFVEVPEEASEEQVREWVQFELHNACIQTANPLSNHDMEAEGYISVRKLA